MIRKTLGLIAASVALGGGPLAWASATLEYKVKAAYLYNFSTFIEWPPQAFSSPEDPVVLGVLGSNPFNGELDRRVFGKVVNGRTLVVRRFEDAESAKAAHILFISSSERRRLAGILEALKGLPVVTVGEAPGFVQKGGVIRFFLKDGKVRFEINRNAGAQAQVKISSSLLRLARLWPEEERP